MSFFGKKPKTAQQKAQMAKTRIMLRGVALIYIVFFIIVPMIQADSGDMDPLLRYAIIAFFIIASGVLAVLTALEYIRGNKAGRYKEEGYTDDEDESDGSVTGSESNDDNDENDDDEYEDDDEDYDDEDYDDDDDDDNESDE